MLPGYRDYAKEWFVNGEIWTLSFVNKIDYNGRENWGLCDPSTYTIQIVKKLERIDLLDTFFHEIDHAIEFSYDIKEPKKKRFDTHQWITLMGTYRAEFFRDNLEDIRLLFKV